MVSVSSQIFLGEVFGWREQLHTGVVDENVKVAKVFDDVIYEFTQRGDATEIDWICSSASALRFDCQYCLVQGSLLTGCDRYVRTSIGERLHDSTSDPATAAGDERDFSRKTEFVHERPFLFIKLRRRRLCEDVDE